MGREGKKGIVEELNSFLGCWVLECAAPVGFVGYFFSVANFKMGILTNLCPILEQAQVVLLQYD